jgi:hypothetical protein
MHKKRRDWIPIFTAILVLTGCSLTVTFAGEGVDAANVLDRLKGLQGTWRGEAHQVSGPTEGEHADKSHSVTHEFRVSAAGSVVMEIMGPGTDHEMINMYHVDGQDLLLTHYCALGNQPSMKLDRPGSSPDNLKFDFAGGTNLDPTVDQHIHNSRVIFADSGTLESLWTSHNHGKQESVMKFKLRRAE